MARAQAGLYTLLHAGGEVEVFALAANPSAGGLNVDSVFRVVATGACYANQRSVVRLGSDGGFAFRNAPHFAIPHVCEGWPSWEMAERPTTSLSRL